MDELASNHVSSPYLVLTPLFIPKTTHTLFLWKFNHPTRPTQYIMPSIFNNNTPAPLPSWSVRRQRRRLPERAPITVEDISNLSFVATTEMQWTLGEPATLAHALHGHHFTRWALHRRINLVWGQLEPDNGRSDLDTVVGLPQRGRNGACGVRTGACNQLLQGP